MGQGIPGPPTGTKPTGEIPAATGPPPEADGPPAGMPVTAPVETPQDEHIVVGGGGGGGMKIVLIIIIVIVVLVGALFGAYFAKPDLLPGSIRKVFDSFLGGGGEQAPVPAEAPAEPAPAEPAPKPAEEAP